MRYTQLTQEERYQIYILKKTGYQQKEIADTLERDKSTISRELRRNRGLRGYRPKQAHAFFVERRYAKVRPRIDSQVWQLIETLIRQEWSPEQITSRLEMEKGVHISHEWIYQYVYADKRSGGDLYRTEIEHAMNRLNHRPRKSLAFRTPYEIFFKTRTSLTVALQT